MSFLISTACVRLKMSGVAKNVLMQLAEMANDHGFAFPSIDYLCMRTCWGRTAVIEALKFLEEHKVIEPNRESGRNTTYWVTPENWAGERYPDKAFNPSAKRTGSPAVPVRQTDPTRPPAGLDPSAKRTLVSTNTNELNTPPTPKGAASGFEEFWKTYPKKSGEALARRQWQKLVPDAALQKRIIEAVREQSAADEWRRDCGRYVPKASAWLSGERWLDEVAKPAPSGVSTQVSNVWHESAAGVAAKAAELGLKPRDEVMEFHPAFKARVMAAALQSAVA